ncbi:probable 2-oxoglutarate-dependent dioxygenase AOP1 [Argentina anserina]|uniref:probable 2-oxoglutarate-dependent dioxygenase AOP1 n=1 Tax=Argentina anserina TaxID=57926 RepID=UPI0021768E8D|nr:probable 2-oxoglutarate-dependent dioxygenase AOP1 [Potentilla anserina]
MGSDSHYQIPSIDFSINSTELDRGTEGWYSLCKNVREACENHGCFEIVYDKIPLELKRDTFAMIRQLFNLPVETKEKNVNPKPFHGYYGRYPTTPLYESFGIEDSSNIESFKSFTNLMWPNGHNHFCDTVVTMMKKLDELKEMIEMMILDSYGLGEKLNSIIPCKTLLRVMKYDAPPSGLYENGHYGLTPHTDKLVSTILCDDQVSGLEYETKDGQWVKLSLSPTSYLFIVGDPLMAWSNGRMHRLKHRVMISGEKERYSLGAFGSPLEGTIIKAEKDLVDKEHPRILKDFDYKDFSNFTFTQEGSIIDSEKQVFAFAGIST